jgi:hypothetical protein
MPQTKQIRGKVKNKKQNKIAIGSFCACGLSMPITPPIIQGKKLTTAKKILITQNINEIIDMFTSRIYTIMESLAKLVVIIFFAIYLSTLIFEIIALIFIIEKYLKYFSGWWYFLWIPILMSANWLISMLILIILSKIGNRTN